MSDAAAEKKKGGMDVQKAWGIVILVILFVFTDTIGMLIRYFNQFLNTIEQHQTLFLGIAGIGLLAMVFRPKKKEEAHAVEPKKADAPKKDELKADAPKKDDKPH